VPSAVRSRHRTMRGGIKAGAMLAVVTPGARGILQAADNTAGAVQALAFCALRVVRRDGAVGWDVDPQFHSVVVSVLPPVGVTVAPLPVVLATLAVDVPGTGLIQPAERGIATSQDGDAGGTGAVCRCQRLG